MLDLQFLCENLDLVAENCRRRGVSCDLDRLVALRDQRSQLIQSVDAIRREQNEISGKIPKASAEERPALVQRGKELKEQVSGLEADLKQTEADLRELQASIPNLTHPDAPVGGESDFALIREVGTRPAFDFAPKDHLELMQSLDLIDLDAGARVAGHGFYFLKNEAVLLELALVQFAVQTLRNAGFTIFTTPDLARDEILDGTGYLPRGPETQIYSIAESDLSLIATAEITLAGMLRDQILPEDDLPLKFCGISHCFRTEAGSHGRATRGIYRVHQFTKVEMFGFTAPDLEASTAMHDEILRLEEQIFQALEVPYRVIDTPSGDLGGPAYRKFDLEAWMPGRGEGGEYGEVTSASNCTDYQARRLGIRCRSRQGKGNQFVHTLNGTAVACSRAIIAVLENHQQADGSILIPEALRPWMGMDRIGPRPAAG